MAKARAALSPLSIFLCALFLFSANVFAASAVLGVDLGTEYIKAALVKPGIPLQIVLTKDSRRKETSAIAFKPPQNGPKPNSYPERLYGSDAMAIHPRFPGDVYPNLKALLGLPLESAAVKEYASMHPALQLEAHKTRNTAMFKSKGAFTPEEDAWLVEEILAMELQSIQKNAEALAGSDTTVRSVVITVPPFYTMEEKRAIEMAADLAGLRVLSLISDGLAVGLNYATSRQFPNINEGGKPEHHLIFDMGAGSTKATVMKFQSRTVKDVGKFNKTFQEVQVLGSGWDRTLGGDALNYLIVDDMVKSFVETSGAKKISAAAEDVMAQGRVIAKLLKEAERLRHVLSANQNTGGSFEGLYEDVDFKYKITRAGFEKMAEEHANRVAAAVQGALEMANIKDSDLDSVILHGGATRTPFVQKQLEKIFGGADKLRSNVNSDEAAVFGAGFRAAEISPSFRVKEIRVAEGSVYPVTMKWTNAKDKTQRQQLWTETSHLGGTPKEITFNNNEDFSIEFSQNVPVGPELEDKPTKTFTTKNLTETVAMLVEKHSCEPSAVQFKVSMQLSVGNGEVEVTKATVQCEAEEPAENEGIIGGVKNLFGFGGKKGEQEPLKDGESSEAAKDATPSSSTTETSKSATTTTSDASAEASESVESKPKPPTKKLIVVPVKVTVEKSGVPELSKTELQGLKTRLKAFEASDKARRLREETLNQLEGFTYKIRDLVENEDFVAASTEAERKILEEKNSEASDWLYGDGVDATRDELKKKLTGLQDLVNPIQRRIEESRKRPELIKDLKDAVNRTNTFVKSIKDQIDEYEAFQASASATPSATSSTTTPAPSPDDFADLEDDDAKSSTTTVVEDPLADRGPLPPLYKVEDLKESEDLAATTTKWLEEKEAEQAKLGPTDDPVLLVKDLTSKREKLDKAGMDLAMKMMKNFENTQKKEKKKSSKSKKATKTKKAAKTKAEGPEAGSTIELKPGKDGESLSEEELEELLKKLSEQQPKEGAEGIKVTEDIKEEKEEVKHDEL